MSNRHIHLGSGLQIAKLTDAIKQVKDGEAISSPSLVCNNPAYDDAWVRLSIRVANDDHERSHYWDMTAGYSDSVAPNLLIGDLIRTIPDSRINEWKREMYFQILIPLSVAPEAIAELIIYIVTLVQHAESSSTDVILEHQGRSGYK